MNYSCARYELKCNECGKRYGNQPLSGCPDCLAPLRLFTILKPHAVSSPARPSPQARQTSGATPHFFPFPTDFSPTSLWASRRWSRPPISASASAQPISTSRTTPSASRRSASRIASSRSRWPTRSASASRPSGCSSTGNLANSVAAQAARLGLKACILVPADLEPAKILNTAGLRRALIRIDGNYDHVNRLCTQIADEYNWGFVNVNLRPYYAEGSKTVGYEIAEQLGWRLPDNVVVPMAGGSLIRKIRKAFQRTRSIWAW